MSADLHFATAWEIISDCVGDRDAIVQNSARWSWRRLEDQAARLAGSLDALGVRPGAKVGLFLYNDPEHLIAQFAAFKVRAVPVNVNYRYLEDEVAYILENSDSEVLFFDSSLGDRVRYLRERVPSLRHIVEVGPPASGPAAERNALAYDDLLAAAPLSRIERPGDDLYMLYTGGTTGMPKGVMYRIGEFCSAQFQRVAPPGVKPILTVDDIPGVIAAHDAQDRSISIPASPLMHGMGMWAGAMRTFNAGGTVVLLAGRSFDAHELWRAVEVEGVTSIAIVGDAFARPMLRALERADSESRSYDVSSVRAIFSSGVAFSVETKRGLLDRLPPGAQIHDALGSTEGGAMGATVSTRSSLGTTGAFRPAAAAKVLGKDGREVAPGSGETGMVAGVTLALGYFKDPDRTRETFREIDGVRYAIAGDWATVEADGTITLLGRGSHCINTRGEKVYPEEVEAAVKGYPGVDDCIVVGVPSGDGGERVAVVVSATAGAEVDREALVAWLRARISGYKVPRLVHFVPEVRRAPNGKADYSWGREIVNRGISATDRN